MSEIENDLDARNRQLVEELRKVFNPGLVRLTHEVEPAPIYFLRKSTDPPEAGNSSGQATE